jgi:hypothetical protein
MTMTREFLERGGAAACSEANGASADRLRQDGTVRNQASPSNGAPRLTEASTRRPPRLALQFAIEVCGFDRCGRFFTERSETSNVSDGGCRFYLRTEVDREAVLAVRVIERYDRRGSGSAPVLFQVARIERESSGWTLGALKMHSEDLWPARAAGAHGVTPLLD